jgi:hypothetical protein
MVGGRIGIQLSPLELLEKLSARVPSPRLHPVRQGGCLAPHSQLCAALTPTPRGPGVDQKARAVSARGGWARRLKRVLALDLTRCPKCPIGILRLIAPIPSRPVIRRILRPLKLAADPSPMAQARWSQGRFAEISPELSHVDTGSVAARVEDFLPFVNPNLSSFYPICTISSRRIRLAS